MKNSLLTSTYSEQVNKAISIQMDKVEQCLMEATTSKISSVEEISRHTLLAGGKRLRPLLTILSFNAINLSDNSISPTKLAACMEMLHMATLIHDDVIDHAETRRGVPTASNMYGNTKSILSGDVLLAKAMRLITTYRDINIIKDVSNAMVDLSEGEVYELQNRYNFDLSEQEYFEVIRLKTASLLSACCKIGATLGGGNFQEIQALQEYGNSIGIAFQIVDDLIDYKNDRTQSGKTPMIDFREGCSTLCLMHLKEHLHQHDNQYIRSLFGKELQEQQIQEIRILMAEHGSFEFAETLASKYIDRSIEALKIIQDSDYKEMLIQSSKMITLAMQS